MADKKSGPVGSHSTINTESVPPEPAVRIAENQSDDLTIIKHRLAAVELQNLKLRSALLGFVANPSAISADPELCNAVQEALK